MPSTAYGLVTLFALVSLVAGIVAVRVVGPPRLVAYVVPVAAAFLGLYVIGHKLGLDVGPKVELFGFEVSLVFDVAVAFVVAFAAAGLQRVLIGLGDRGRARADA
jgi:hypothetical protein